MNIAEFEKLDRWQGAARVLAGGFVAFAGLGLLVSLAMVFYDSGLNPADVANRFAGPETDDIFPHSLGSLLQTTHTHLYTIAFLQLLLGGLFLLSTVAEKTKALVIAAAWIFIAIDHAGMWLMFQWGKAFVYMMMLGGTGMMLAMGFQVLVCLRDLLKPRSL